MRPRRSSGVSPDGGTPLTEIVTPSHLPSSLGRHEQQHQNPAFPLEHVPQISRATNRNSR